MSVTPGLLLLLRPGATRNPTWLSVADAFTRALLARDDGALTVIAEGPAASGEATAHRLVSQLPPGELALEKTSVFGGVGANSATLIVTVTSGTGGRKTVTVPFIGDVGEAALDDPDWRVAYSLAR